MKNFFSRSPSPSNHYNSMPPSPNTTFSTSMMDENIELAETVISKYNNIYDSSSHNKSPVLFTGGDRTNSRQFLKAVDDLQFAMKYFISENSSSDKLVRGQNLMQMAMKMLEKEFYLLLSANRDFLDAESLSNRSSTRSSVSDSEEGDDSEDDIQVVRSENQVLKDPEIVMADLKLMADCMISCGYGKECAKIYKLVRKSMVDETLYYLGVQNLSFSQVQKLDWELLEIKIKQWLNAVKVAMKTLFHGERILCDHVFSASERIRESCFTEIATSGALMLFVFPENVAKCKKSPEKMFRLLDLYEAVSEHWQGVELIFSFESTAAVRSQALTSLIKLGDAVNGTLSEFEAAIQKHTSKSVLPGGGVHPLTRYVMNYFVFLTDYTAILPDILADHQLNKQTTLPESYFSVPSPDRNPSSSISVLFAWIILVLLCKLDREAQLYKDVSLSYLFLANNLNYVVSKIRHSNLKPLFGDDWLIKHESKVNQYAANYEKMGWNKVISSLPENPSAVISPAAAMATFQKFNSGFDEVYRKQSTWTVADPKLRDRIKASVARNMIPVYRQFYEMNRELFSREVGVQVIVRFAPEDLGKYISDLFSGNSVGDNTTAYSSVTSPPAKEGRRR